MEYNIPSSPIDHEPGDNWNTPKQARVHQMRRDGNSWSTIFKQLKVPKSSAQTICKDKSSQTTQKGKVYQRPLINIRTTQQIIRHIAYNFSSQQLTFEQVCRQLGIVASIHTIQRHLRRAGY
jgi:hypothetical protein